MFLPESMYMRQEREGYLIEIADRRVVKTHDREYSSTKLP